MLLREALNEFMDLNIYLTNLIYLIRKARVETQNTKRLYRKLDAGRNHGG